jgi:hypothetical protein
MTRAKQVQFSTRLVEAVARINYGSGWGEWLFGYTFNDEETNAEVKK